MALCINPRITEAEARKILADWRSTPAGAYRSWLWDTLQRAQEEPTPHLVVYTPFAGCEYIPPAAFAWCMPPASPSDCTWVVPGTERWT